MSLRAVHTMETFTASIWPSSRFAEHEDSCPRISPEVNKSCELHTSSILATPLSFSPRLLRHGFPQKDRKSTLSCSGSVRCAKSSSEDAAFRRSADHSSLNARVNLTIVQLALTPRPSSITRRVADWWIIGWFARIRSVLLLL